MARKGKVHFIWDREKRNTIKCDLAFVCLEWTASQLKAMAQELDSLPCAVHDYTCLYLGQ